MHLLLNGLFLIAGIGWSIVFNLVMFPMLRFHYKFPVAALLSSIPIIFFFIFYFHVPVHVLK
ncbi:hypothetical protein J2S09_005100 [Bacillus fengqiuensis]|nr:hypothetical protein [Bacillus fengqiuensis]